MSDKYMTDRQFDDKIREMLAEPQEHLPAGLWDGIEARLDAVGTGRRKAAVVPWRRVVAGVASSRGSGAHVCLWALFPSETYTGSGDAC